MQYKQYRNSVKYTMRHLHFFVVVSLVDDQFLQKQTIMATVLLLYVKEFLN